MLFIVFDIESVFLIPYAVYFDSLKLFGLVEMVLFIVTVFVAFAYVWRRGGLEWDRGAGHGCRGEAAGRGPADHGRGPGRLHAQGVVLAGHLRPGLLRHRDDDLRRPQVRPGPLRHGGLPRQPPPGRPDDRRRPRQPEDGAGPPPDLRPDGRPQVG